MPRYSNAVVTLAMTWEREYYEMHFATQYAEQRFDYSEARVQGWADLRDRAEWWDEQLARIFPGATQCEHGLSLSLCAGPGHYPPDDQIGW